VANVETERLLLRIPEGIDAAPLLAIHEDPRAIGRVVLTARPGDLSRAWRNIARMVGHWQLRGFGEWTVVEKSSQEVIGRVGFNYHDGSDATEFGWIIRSDCWGQRFASEAARAALAWIWPNTSIPFAISNIASDNIASIRIALRLGGIERSRPLHDATESVKTYLYARPALACASRGAPVA
jgi:RimJ/RimL family protein N-acetyltransferase